MSRALLLVATLLLGACGTSTSLPAPEILSVSPNRVPINEKGTKVTISLNTVIAVQVDYAKEEASSTGARVLFDEVEVEPNNVYADGTIKVPVPEGLKPDRTYDVRVLLSDGREAVKTDAFTLSTPNDDGDGPGEDTADAGDIPEEIFDAGTFGDLDGGSPLDAGVKEPGDAGPVGEGDVTGFEFAHIDDQQGGQRFQITIKAIGPRAHLFQESVEVKPNKKGSVSPTMLGPFINGALEDFPITVDAKGGNIKLTVTGPFGAQGTSNGFKVR